MKAIQLVAASVLALAAAGSAWAHAPAPVGYGSAIDARQDRQHARIDHGVAHGALTRREAAVLRAQQARIARAERLAWADGRLTRSERRYLSELQRHASLAIRHQAHDGQRARW